MTFQAFERGLWGLPYQFVEQLSRLRLGYEVVSLADKIELKTQLKISKREDAGIGVNSDVSPFIPKELESQLTDYHTWSLFNTYWAAIDLFNPSEELSELQYRVLYLIRDEELAHKNVVLRRCVVNPVSGEQSIVEEASPHFDYLISERERTVTSEDKLRAFENPLWRQYARRLSHLSLVSKQDYFQNNRKDMLEALADVSKGNKILETAKPTVDAIEQLLVKYISETSHYAASADSPA
ncbi:MAG: hypothetical protein RL557_715 [archaeon]|jgi:hypothetical protein